MPDQNLMNFVQSAFARGMSDDSIKTSLKTVGWSEDKIAEAISFARAMQSQAPAGGSAVVPSSISAFEHSNSPYAIVLCAVLAVVLIVYSNTLLSDLSDQFALSARLIISAVVAIPFILLSFLMHFSFEGDGSKVAILPKAFHIASAWLILRLLFDVSQYILQNAAGLGVYLVLGLIIVVLTSVILFVQKFVIKK